MQTRLLSVSFSFLFGIVVFFGLGANNALAADYTLIGLVFSPGYGCDAPPPVGDTYTSLSACQAALTSTLGGQPNTCNPPLSCRAASPTVSCSASPTPLSYGGTTYVSWNPTNATSCSIANYGSVSAVDGPHTIPSPGIGPVISPITRDVTCSNSTGTVTCPLTINSKPDISVSVSPSNITGNGTFTVSMTSSNASSCTWSRSSSWGGDWSNVNSGTSLTVQGVNLPPGNATYSFTCSNSAGSVSGSGSVTITPAATGSITPNSCVIASGASSCTMPQYGPISGSNPGVQWTSSNTSGTVTVVRAYAGNSVFATGPSGNNPATWAPPGTYHMNLLVDGTTQIGSGADFTVTCASGTAWNGSVCAPSAVPTVNIFFQ